MNRSGLTRLEKLALGVAGAVFLLVLIPLYQQVVDIKRTADCLSNLKEIATALNLYQMDYGGALPVAYYADAGGQPLQDAQGRPLTWVLGISGYVRKELEHVLLCPADPLGGSTLITHPRDPTRMLRLSYGFYAPLSARRVADLPNPGQTVLIADSVAGGQLGTIDPLPLAEGNDGFVLTFDDSLLAPTPQSRFIARLAVWRIRNDGGWVAGNLRAFHGKGVNVLHADGHVATRPPTIILLEREPDGKIKPPWSLPEPRR
ncbi:MAG: H-X9-DG-CTERM domain-containing protein [Armatimonadota bacterium]